MAGQDAHRWKLGRPGNPIPQPGFQQRADGQGGQARGGLVNPIGGRQIAGGDRRHDKGGIMCKRCWQEGHF
jgi:hypothetical protein